MVAAQTKRVMKGVHVREGEHCGLQIEKNFYFEIKKFHSLRTLSLSSGYSLAYAFIH
jgi:hypothetical protein